MAHRSLPIKRCRACHSQNLLTVFDMGELYISKFANSKIKLKKYPLKLVLCLNCLLLQLKDTTPPSELYTNNYGYRSGINNTIKNDLGEIVGKIIKLKKIEKDSTVLDIGANDGTLLSFYPNSVFRVAVDPIKKFAKESRNYSNKVITDFFNFSSYSRSVGNKKVDVVTAISCFYDLEDPNKFLDDIDKILKEDGIFVIQQNYLGTMIKQKAFDNIVHEHLEFYSLISLKNLMTRHGFEIFNVELNNINGGSFRAYIGRKGFHGVKKSVSELASQEIRENLNQKKTYLDFAKSIQDNGNKLRKFIIEVNKKNKTVYAYGASTRGNTLLQYYNLDNTLIKKAVERNPEKWGKEISSMKIPIISEAQARAQKPDYMLVLPWFFKKEFLERENDYLRSGGHFIFPLPEFEIV